jgi:hypothetical protein
VLWHVQVSPSVFTLHSNLHTDFAYCQVTDFPCFLHICLWLGNGSRLVSQLSQTYGFIARITSKEDKESAAAKEAAAAAAAATADAAEAAAGATCCCKLEQKLTTVLIEVFVLSLKQ